jgi:hypothetical protein
MVPMFCDEPFFNITTPDGWMRRFYSQDGGRADGHAQCKYRSSQRDIFLETMRRRFAQRQKGKTSDEADIWNEVCYC